jgi:hypothetical protein
MIRVELGVPRRRPTTPVAGTLRGIGDYAVIATPEQGAVGVAVRAEVASLRTEPFGERQGQRPS